MTRFLAEQLSTAHWFDQRETRELLNWAPAVSLDEGLARLAGHYGAHQPPVDLPSLRLSGLRTWKCR
jgi:nucleoside-diphosphate-sugar epimerase